MPESNSKPPSDSRSTWNNRIHESVRQTGNFWERVTDGIELDVLWSQFKSEARSSYGLYSKEIDWEKLDQKKKGARYFQIARALAWAMLMKMPPARRLFLLLVLLFTILGAVKTQLFGLPSALNLTFGFAGLLLVLALELAEMKRDLEIAREIQGWLVPKNPPHVNGVDIAFSTRPANTVAGDYYDALLRPGRGTDESSTKLLLVVADVAGKSVPAALLMATFQASLQTLAPAKSSLSELVIGLNQYASAHSLNGLRFTTAFFAEYDPATRAVEYINAGHNPPFLRRVSGKAERLEEGGLPLGISATATYASGTATLERGDLLVIFTDGVVEAFNDADEEYGDERLLHILDCVPGESASESLRFILADVDSFAGGTRQNDDITCLLMRVN
ncbi:MAG: serine/threonine-protein phosphatase [Acidobacteria bacterium]|nr:serine/threonine-protein phosphatase [Acidobacteriota bacterium]